jgi:hypothetical protein
MVDVSAAKHNRRKKEPPTTLPMTGPMSRKTPGSTMNTNGGPSEGERCCENTSGNTIKPARNATEVSASAITTDDETIFSFFLR